MKVPMHRAVHVANRLLELAAAARDPLTPMQLLKLVYICHGWMLGLYGRPLIGDSVEAWKYGPVIPALYREVRQFRSDPVVGPIAAERGRDFDEQEADIIRQVFEIYGHLSGIALSRMTHADGTPWKLTWEPDSYGLTISNDLIEEHYRELYERGQKERAAAT